MPARPHFDDLEEARVLMSVLTALRLAFAKAAAAPAAERGGES